jgi:hypothetical protein
MSPNIRIRNFQQKNTKPFKICLFFLIVFWAQISVRQVYGCDFGIYISHIHQSMLTNLYLIKLKYKCQTILLCRIASNYCTWLCHFECISSPSQIRQNNENIG